MGKRLCEATGRVRAQLLRRQTAEVAHRASLRALPLLREGRMLPMTHLFAEGKAGCQRMTRAN